MRFFVKKPKRTSIYDTL